MSGASFFLKCLEPGAGLPPPQPRLTHSGAPVLAEQGLLMSVE